MSKNKSGRGFNKDQSNHVVDRPPPAHELAGIQHAVNWLGAQQIASLVAIILVVLVLVYKCDQAKPNCGKPQKTSARDPAIFTAESSRNESHLIQAQGKDTAVSRASTTPVGLTRWPFGGPYGFKETYQKVLDFEQSCRLKLAYSEATYITASNRDLFARSIDTNKHNEYGADFQRYNFVIDGYEPDKRNWRIKVAVWRGGTSTNGLNLKNSDGTPFGNMPGIMINFFPEDVAGAAHFKRYSPMWISAISSTGLKDTGILDALSKHFMLANVPVGGGVELFDRAKWLDAEVAYAGEMLVDVKGNYYVLTNGSGTYRPDESHLEAVARYFEEVVGVAPMYLQSPKPDPGSIRPFLTTVTTSLPNLAPASNAP